ncbi:hypothetical protein FACS1894184_19740 [Clostridia bacterium]|nr:hypothetical protein FACS1894184_19740 [Clostridia bacterium]
MKTNIPDSAAVMTEDSEKMVQAKEYLEKVQVYESRVSSKLAQLQSLRDISSNVGRQLSSMPRNPSPDLQKSQTLTAKICDLQIETNDAIEEFVNYLTDVGVLIEQIDNVKYKRILEMRYILKMRWPQIYKELGYSEAGVEYAHKQALKEFEKFMPN